MIIPYITIRNKRIWNQKINLNQKLLGKKRWILDVASTIIKMKNKRRSKQTSEVNFKGKLQKNLQEINNEQHTTQKINKKYYKKSFFS